MADVRELVPHVQQMVDLAVPVAEAVPIEGDFTVTLYIKRRGGEVETDAQISLNSTKRRRK